MSQVAPSRVRVRAYECDSFGHVNNAVYIQYLQQATLDALGAVDDPGAAGTVRRLRIDYRASARYGDTLTVTTWVTETRDGGVGRGYRIALDADAKLVVSAEIDWQASDTAAWRPDRRPTDRAPHDGGARPFRWRHRVRRYELDATGRVAAAAPFNWLEEATYHAAAVAGWPLARLEIENVVSLQYQHAAEFFDAARNGDEVEVESRLIKVRRARGTWLHEVWNVATGALLLRARSTGVFLDRAGAIRAAPAEPMAALVRGEPADAAGSRINAHTEGNHDAHHT